MKIDTIKTKEDYLFRLKKIQEVKERAVGYGFKECIGCGYCCRRVPCFLGMPGERGCYWLEYNGEKWRCALLLEETLKNEREALKSMLYINCGCCSPFNDWRALCVVPTPKWIEEHGESSSVSVTFKGADKKSFKWANRS